MWSVFLWWSVSPALTWKHSRTSPTRSNPHPPLSAAQLDAVAVLRRRTVWGSFPLKTLFICMWCVSFNLESLSLRFVAIIEVNLSLLFVTLNHLADVKQYDQRLICTQQARAESQAF